MNLRLFSLFLASLMLFSACSLFKKDRKPKENPAIAADTDENFRTRFVEKRVAELTAEGMSATAAQAQAAEEFKVRYGYTSAAKK
jgi:hypothetical protein